MFNAKSVGKLIGSFARDTQRAVVNTYNDTAKGTSNFVAGIKAGYNEVPQAPAPKKLAKPAVQTANTAKRNSNRRASA